MTKRATLWHWLTAGLLLTVASGARGDSCDSDLGKWLECNNPRVIAYLSSLAGDQIGTVLDGVVLTDGSNPFKGLTLLGHPNVEHGTHIYVVGAARERSAYVWVEPGGAELWIPRCPQETVLGNAFVLSGDVYTWNAVRPGDGVVRLECAARAWLNSPKPAESPKK